MDIVNYDSSYFNSAKLSGVDKKKMDYLHYVVVKHLIDIIDNKQKEDEVKPIINSLNLKVKKGELIGIKGLVGSGKSSLFCCLLGEMKPIDVKLDSTEAKPLYFDYFEHGDLNQNTPQFIKMYGKVAYCPQNSPIFSSTIRENICFYKPYEE